MDFDPNAAATPPLDFSAFILSLSTSAMVNLGMIEDPISKTKHEDVAVAQQHIQIIEMLREKTQGNLNEAEQRLINEVLYHLRIGFIQKTKK